MHHQQTIDYTTENIIKNWESELIMIILIVSKIMRNSQRSDQTNQVTFHSRPHNALEKATMI